MNRGRGRDRFDGPPMRGRRSDQGRFARKGRGAVPTSWRCKMAADAVIMEKTVSSIAVVRKDRRRIVVNVTVDMTTARAVPNRWIVPVPTVTDSPVVRNVGRVQKAVSGGRSEGMTKDGVALVPARNGGTDRKVSGGGRGEAMMKNVADPVPARNPCPPGTG